jgi:predicted amidohydrolase YtcJ
MLQADTVIQNAEIYTLDSKRSWANALAIQANRFIYVGASSEVTKYIGPDTVVLDLNGKLVLPGFIDSHAHVSGSPNPEVEADLYNLASKAEIISAVKQFADTHPEHDVIYGGGWKNEFFGPAGPIKEDLDAIVADRPVLLTSEDGHFAWVNSKAIELAGVSETSVNPPGGLIEKNSLTGEPRGTFRETARDLIQNILPPFTTDQIKDSIHNYMQEAARVGITSVHDPLLVLPAAQGQLNGFGYLSNNIRAFNEMAREKRLNIRVRGTVLTDPTAGVDQIDTIAAVCKKQRPQFQITGIKVFVDGVVEGGTAYLREPYAHMPDSYGLPLWEPDALNEVITTADKAGLQIHIHVIGDAALRMALDDLEQAQIKNGKRDSRHLITHLHTKSLIRRNACRWRTCWPVLPSMVPMPTFWSRKPDRLR